MRLARNYLEVNLPGRLKAVSHYTVTIWFPKMLLLRGQEWQDNVEQQTM